MHEYAAQKMLESVQNKFCHEVAVALSGYLLGEVGVNICEKPGMGGYDQFTALHQHFGKCGVKTQAILLTSYAKLLNLYPETKDVISDVFRKYSTSRCVRYFHISDIAFFDFSLTKFSRQFTNIFIYELTITLSSPTDSFFISLFFHPPTFSIFALYISQQYHSFRFSQQFFLR